MKIPKFLNDYQQNFQKAYSQCKGLSICDFSIKYFTDEYNKFLRKLEKSSLELKINFDFYKVRESLYSLSPTFSEQNRKYVISSLFKSKDFINIFMYQIFTSCLIFEYYIVDDTMKLVSVFENVATIDPVEIFYDNSTVLNMLVESNIIKTFEHLTKIDNYQVHLSSLQNCHMFIKSISYLLLKQDISSVPKGLTSFRVGVDDSLTEKVSILLNGILRTKKYLKCYLRNNKSFNIQIQNDLPGQVIEIPTNSAFNIVRLYEPLDKQSLENKCVASYIPMSYVFCCNDYSLCDKDGKVISVLKINIQNNFYAMCVNKHFPGNDNTISEYIKCDRKRVAFVETMNELLFDFQSYLTKKTLELYKAPSKEGERVLNKKLINAYFYSFWVFYLKKENISDLDDITLHTKITDILESHLSEILSFDPFYFGRDDENVADEDLVKQDFENLLQIELSKNIFELGQEQINTVLEVASAVCKKNKIEIQNLSTILKK
jgi:hypothetical protein